MLLGWRLVCLVGGRPGGFLGRRIAQQLTWLESKICILYLTIKKISRKRTTEVADMVLIRRRTNLVTVPQMTQFDAYLLSEM